jgi:hypothetical protein
MKYKYRLILLILSIITLVLIGRFVIGDFKFLINDFWFTSGIFLVILLSLIDQPYFSKDGSVFVNSVTASISLLLLPAIQRTALWYLMLGLVLYLIISSYVFMLIRKDELKNEPKILAVMSRINRIIGKPDVLFSIFFIWGVIEKFAFNSTKADALFFFWAIYILLNIPAVAGFFDELLTNKAIKNAPSGKLISITNPSAAFVQLRSDSTIKIGNTIVFHDKKNRKIANGTIIDDRIVANRRIAKVVITCYKNEENTFSNESLQPITMEQDNSINEDPKNLPISIVDTGSMIAKVQFFINPMLPLESGELVWVKINNSKQVFYQVVSAEIVEEKIEEKNEIQYIKVIAGQLGEWLDHKSSFEPVKWVAQAGEIVRKIDEEVKEYAIPDSSIKVGDVPNSSFPVHVDLDDLVTHNCAILGVTGSGKSYLAFHLIEGLAKQKIKVMILDSSRQHYIYLNKHTPYALKTTDDISKWIDSDILIGIHQFAIGTSYPAITAEFVSAAFDKIQSNVTLKAGSNEKARLCIVFEEAHSLIPEWNQVAEEGDKVKVNRTARVILQGRKYGIGSIIITQRTANVTKTILNQCNTIFAMQSFDQTGLDFLKNYMGDDYANTISTMPTRHSILVGKASSSNRPIMFKIMDMDYR